MAAGWAASRGAERAVPCRRQRRAPAHPAQSGIRHPGLKRGDAEADSDVDLVVEFDPAAEMDLVRLVALERRIGAKLGRPVEILPEPVENPRLRANVERDRLIAF